MDSVRQDTSKGLRESFTNRNKSRETITPANFGQTEIEVSCTIKERNVGSSSLQDKGGITLRKDRGAYISPSHMLPWSQLEDAGGNDFDAWGQFVEASEEYRRLSQEIKKQLLPDNKLFTDQQKKCLHKISASLEIRRKALQSSQAEDITLEDLKQVYPVLENILSANKETFPIDIVLSEQYNLNCECNLTVEDDHLNELDDLRVGGTLLPRIPFEARCHRLTIRIVKIGLKDPSDYIDPFITVSIKDMNGMDITASQDTPVAKVKETNYVIFSSDVELQRVIEKLPKGSAVFFEFKHFKPKKKHVSTKCWAFMELDELKAGPACIELYKKPTDSFCKKIHLLTVKPLYLHLLLTFHDDD